MAVAVVADVLVEGTAQVLSRVFNWLLIRAVNEYCGSEGYLAIDGVIRDDVFCSIFINVNITELDASSLDRFKFLKTFPLVREALA